MDFVKSIVLTLVFFSSLSGAAAPTQEALQQVATSYVALMNGYGQARDHEEYYKAVDYLFSSSYTATRDGRTITTSVKHLKNRMGHLKSKGRWTLSALHYEFDLHDKTLCRITVRWCTEARGIQIFTIGLRSLNGKTIHSISESS